MDFEAVNKEVKKSVGRDKKNNRYNRLCGDQIATLMLMNIDGILPSS